MKQILSGSTIGIIGGGQLGRMLCIEAVKLGYNTITFCPKTSEPAPAEQVSSKIIYANYDDKKALKEFSSLCDIVTFEFENIPSESIKFVENIVTTSPSSKVISIAQNRVKEREFFNKNNLPCHKYKYISSSQEALNFLNNNNLEKAIIKTADFGYDGKGQIRIKKSDNIEEIWSKSDFKHAVIEEFVSFKKEISVIIARNENGGFSTLPIGENIHQNGILKESIIPANIEKCTKDKAISIAKEISNLLNYVGVMAVEFFVLENGDLYINEIAPRVHNSGHWSLDGCVTNQFEQHIRTICGITFGDTELTVNKVTMKNIIGLEMNDIQGYYNAPNCKIHIYNKTEIKEGRKLAHVNILEI